MNANASSVDACCPWLQACRPRRLHWLRLNRVLGWSLVLSPVVQIALGTDFWRGFWFDIGLAAVHGGLSLALFGKPPAPQGALWLWVGVRQRASGPRQRFMFTAWRIALALIWAAPFYAVAQLSTPLFWWSTWLWWATAAIVPINLLVRLPWTLISHVHDAAEYALRRWGLRDGAVDGAVLVAAFFIVVHTVNLLR